MVVAGMYTLNLDQVVWVLFGPAHPAKQRMTLGSTWVYLQVFIPCKYFSLVHTQVHVGAVARPIYLAEKREDTLLFIAESTSTNLQSIRYVKPLGCDRRNTSCQT